MTIPTPPRQLPPPPERLGLGRDAALAALKKYLRVQDQRIRMLHNGGAGGIEVAGARAALFDAILGRLCGEARALHAGDKGGCPPLALVAVGGYGRGLLNPHSDIDLLFLYEGRQPGPVLPEVVNDVLYLLWDLGLKLGHAVRSTNEALHQAADDFQTLSAMIEARLVAGEEPVFEGFRKQFHKRCIAGREDLYLANRQADMRDRHAKNFGSVYVQEPNVKTGMGGLRDCHNLIWTTYTRLGTTDWQALVAAGVLTASACKELDRAYDFLLRVRNDLHYHERRARDLLTLHLQGVVATSFHYPQRSILRRCEAFMRDYYQATRDIRQITTQAIEAFHIDSARKKRRRRGFLRLLRRKPAAAEVFDGFFAEDGRCHAADAGVFREDPGRLLRLFQHTRRRNLRLAPELKDLIAASYSLVNKAFRYNKANRQVFEAILAGAGEVGRTLRQMHRVGILGRYIPEFGALDCLVQHEFFHRYTADEHTLRTIEALDGLAEDNPEVPAQLRQLFREIEDPAILYLALLMHDTGRAENARHHEDASTVLASKVCTRFQIKGERRRLLLFLVDHHLSFWKTATTKNLDDTETIAGFAALVRHPDTLRYLYLLTYADANGTSAESWNGWKAALMRQLFNRTAGYLADSELFRRQAQPGLAVLRAEAAKRLPAGFDDDLATHFEMMPERYFKTRDAEAIAADLRLFRQFLDQAPGADDAVVLPATRWEARPEEGCSLVTVVSWNRRLVLARLAACLSAQNLNILAADIFTRGDDLALDQFRVCTTAWEPVTNAATLKRFQRDLEAVFTAADPDLDALMARATAKRAAPDERLPAFPVRVLVSNEVLPAATFVEIQALDRIGLLFDVFRAVARAGLEVAHARINTTKGAAIDTFALTTRDGTPVTDPQTLENLRQSLEQAIGIGPAPPARSHERACIAHPPPPAV
jgi:[protein-PII] uridylyltransferase